MPGRPKPKPLSPTRCMALGGVLCALSVLLLVFGGFIPLSTFMAPILASLCLLPLQYEAGSKFSFVGYLAVSLLSILLTSDREAALFFVFLTGYYPILQPRLRKIRNRFLRLLCMLILYSASVAVVYTLLLVVLSTPQLAQEFAGQAPWYFAVLWAAGALTFLLYDQLIDKVRTLYVIRLRRHLFR